MTNEPNNYPISREELIDMGNRWKQASATFARINDYLRTIQDEPVNNPIIDKYGIKHWYNEHDQLHRTDGPATICPDGTQYWFINGKLHRTDGPACIYANGSRYWYFNGNPHRTDGPAIESPGGTKEYWIHGNKLTETQFNDITQSPEHLNWYLLKIL